MATYTDDFNRAALGANYSALAGGSGAGQIVSSLYYGAITANLSYIAAYNAGTLGNDCYSQLVFKKPVTLNHGAFLVLRANAALNEYYMALFYQTFASNSRVELYEYVSGFTEIGSSLDDGVLTDGELWKFTVEGTALKIYRAGVEKRSETDSTISSGIYAGLGGVSSVANSRTADDWEAGDLASASTVYSPFTDVFHSRPFHGGVFS